MPKLLHSFIVVASVLVATYGSVASSSAQSTIFVDKAATGAGDGSSWANAYVAVQPALDAAAAGDQVWVAAGRYVENITLKKGVALYGGFAGNEQPGAFEIDQRHLADHETILDGGGIASAITIPMGATAITRVDGFTITNGYARRGGGVYIESSSPTIANNMVVNNRVSDIGGGCYLRNSHAILLHNTIIGNSAYVNCGGIYAGSSAPTIAGNVISNNENGCCMESSSGFVTENSIENNTIIGIVLYYSSTEIASNIISGNEGGVAIFHSSPVVRNNTIKNNVGECGGLGISYLSDGAIISGNVITGNRTFVGGGIVVLNASPMIANNTIEQNVAAVFGGGIGVWSGSPKIVGNLIVGNEALSMDGGGIESYTSSTILNNTIVNNRSLYEGGGLSILGAEPSYLIRNNIVAYNSSGVIVWGEEGLGVGFAHNCVYGNDTYQFSNMDDPTGLNGNISADPAFVAVAGAGEDGLWGTPDDEVGDFRLLAGSSCIDTGSNGDAIGSIDLDGRPRIVDGDGDGTATVDMGAYEYPAVAGDMDSDADVELDDYLRFMAAFGSCAPAGAYAAAADFDADGCVTFVDYQAWLMAYRAFIGNPLAGPPTMPGDFNHDYRVNNADAGAFLACLTGPHAAATSPCSIADADHDNNIDLADYAAFQAAFARSN